jgi:hypothetical protein
MPLKKFSSFINEEKVDNNIKKESFIQESKKPESKPSFKPIEKKTQNHKMVKETKEFSLVGKVANFPKNSKPSESFKKLNENSVSVENVKFIVSKQGETSLCVFKYNRDNKINLKEFSKSLNEHYKKNPKLSKLLETVEIEGNETFSIIKNLPDEKFTDLVCNDLIKLLSK